MTTIRSFAFGLSVFCMLLSILVIALLLDFLQEPIESGDIAVVAVLVAGFFASLLAGLVAFRDVLRVRQTELDMEGLFIGSQPSSLLRTYQSGKVPWNHIVWIEKQRRGSYIVFRLHHNTGKVFDISELIFSEEDRERLDSLISRVVEVRSRSPSWHRPAKLRSS